MTNNLHIHSQITLSILIRFHKQVRLHFALMNIHHYVSTSYLPKTSPFTKYCYASKITLTLPMGSAVFHKVSGFFLCYTLHVGDFVAELDAIEFVRVLEKFRPESGRYELC